MGAQKYPGLKISFSGPSNKMSNDFEFRLDICMMMSDDLQFSSSEISLNDTNVSIMY
jgi:hypothetical protein